MKDKLITILSQLPANVQLSPYEGECDGLNVYSANNEYLGFISMEDSEVSFESHSKAARVFPTMKDKLIAILSQLPANVRLSPYEGECTGLNVYSANHEYLGFIRMEDSEVSFESHSKAARVFPPVKFEPTVMSNFYKPDRDYVIQIFSPESSFSLDGYIDIDIETAKLSLTQAMERAEAFRNDDKAWRSSIPDDQRIMRVVANRHYTRRLDPFTALHKGTKI